MAVVLTYEIWGDPPGAHPIVVHQFYGDTRAEAYAAYATHRAVDSVLDACFRSSKDAKRLVRWWYDERVRSLRSPVESDFCDVKTG